MVQFAVGARPLTFMTAGLLSAWCALKPVDGRALSSTPNSTRDRIESSGVPIAVQRGTRWQLVCFSVRRGCGGSYA